MMTESEDEDEATEGRDGRDGKASDFQRLSWYRREREERIKGKARLTDESS